MAGDIEFRFGHLGNTAGIEGEGWSTGEPVGVWMLDARSTLALPRPEVPGDYVLALELESLIAPGHGFQRLCVSVNGTAVCREALRGGRTVECWVPWPLLEGPAASELVLSHPDGWSPSETGGGDLRVLSFYLRTLTLSLLTDRPSTLEPAPPAPPPPPPAPPAPAPPVPMDVLLLDFESLGPGPAFGLVQRRHGAEPLGLLRFAHAPTDALAAVLEADSVADALAGPASLVLDPRTREYALLDATHGLAFHAGAREGEADPAALERQSVARLPWLARRFAELVAGGERSLVLCDEAAPTSSGAVARLLSALRRHGPVTLLWVGDTAHAGPDAAPPGEVAWAGDRLLRGWTDGSMPAWAALCRAAHRMRDALPR